MKKQNNITPFESDIAKWYSDLVLKSDLISYGPVKGTMFLKPYGFKIWDNFKTLLNFEFSKLEIEEVKFPLLFPESLLKKEKEHVAGFSPEVLKILKIGAKELNDPLIIRPTSEVLFGIYFKDNLNSYSQLPLKLNQWVNVMRWENNTRPFLRNSEFFWQEGHTVHNDEQEALTFSKKIHNLYHKFTNETLLLPTIKGEKTVFERFAGAKNTFTIETILKDGQALQSATSHYLGNSFAKAFEIKIQNKNNAIFNPFQTSWGISTRIIGAIIMTHSDNKGLILPSKIAPFQFVILTLFQDKDERILKLANKILTKLDYNGKIDASNSGIGFKSQEWELKGVPIRIEIGPKDLDNDEVQIAIRNKDFKQKYKISELNTELLKSLLAEYDHKIYESAKLLKVEKKVELKNLVEIKKVVDQGKYGLIYWTENQELEQKIKSETGATIRCLIDSEIEGICCHSNKKTFKKALFARAY